MRNVGSSALLFAAGLALLGLSAPQSVGAQDYAQFEIRYLEALPGHARDLEQALGEHNRRFHSEGASRAVVAVVLNGPRAGQYIWRMGPGTWTAWDARPGDEAHATDWADNVLAHGRSGLVEYVRRMDDLSTRVDQGSEPRPFIRVRYFSVEEPALYRQSQAMQEEAARAVGMSRSRAFFARQFASPDGRDYQLVVSYRSMAELDQPGRGFAPVQEKMIEMFGIAGFNQYRDLREAAGITLMDEWQRVLPELSGSSGGN
jgi:hypothetical protein